MSPMLVYVTGRGVFFSSPAYERLAKTATEARKEETDQHQARCRHMIPIPSIRTAPNSYRGVKTVERKSPIARNPERQGRHDSDASPAVSSASHQTLLKRGKLDCKDLSLDQTYFAFTGTLPPYKVSIHPT